MQPEIKSGGQLGRRSLLTVSAFSSGAWRMEAHYFESGMKR
jgi:hypothetical protein